MAKDYASEWIEKNRGRLIRISGAIWEYAELGLMEYRSSKLLADELERHGFKVERGVAGMPTALVATWGSGKPVIGIMGSTTPCRGLSQKVSPWRGAPQAGTPGHGCGHNIHGTSGIAAAPGEYGSGLEASASSRTGLSAGRAPLS